MPDAQDILRVVSLVDSLLPVVAGLVRDLRGLVSGSGSKSVDEILADADANWAAVIASAKKELARP